MTEGESADLAALVTAAENGSRAAQMELAWSYETGAYGMVDYREAANWYGRAAERGDQQAQYSLALMCLEGDRISKDEVAGRKWLEAAAAGGMDRAMNTIGAAHVHGLYGYPKDPSVAIRWYRTAIERGNTEAKFRLGVLYLDGEVVARDVATGLQLLNEARDEGYGWAGDVLKEYHNPLRRAVRKARGVKTAFNLKLKKMRRRSRHSPDTASAIREVADFCAALTETFSDRLPDGLRSSLPVTAGWWSVALYVQLPMRLETNALEDRVWRTASRAVGEHIVNRLDPDMPDDWPEKDQMISAFEDQVLAACRLWIAAFGPKPEPHRFEDPKALAAELRALLDNEALELRTGFDLDRDDDEETREITLTEFCESFALFFDIASRSRP